MRPSAAARSAGIRPRSIRLATSAVMNTVLPARESPVTPSRITGSENGCASPSMVRPIVSVMPDSAKSLPLAFPRR